MLCFGCLVFGSLYFHHYQHIYLVPGPSGMAFVDELIHSSKELTVALVDKRAKPGETNINRIDWVLFGCYVICQVSFADLSL